MARTILVVDDDPDMRNLLRMHLVNSGYTVHLAEDAVEAGHAVLQEIPSLMLVDVNMPYMSGLELVGAIVKDASVRAFPIIVLTSNDDAQDASNRLGAQFLKKPIQADKLLEAVAKTIKEWSGE